MILNGVIAFILLFSPNLIALRANYTTMVEDRPIISVKYFLPVPVFHFWPKLTHPAALSLCDSWTTCWRIFYSHIHISSSVGGGSALAIKKRCSFLSTTFVASLDCVERLKWLTANMRRLWAKCARRRAADCLWLTEVERSCHPQNWRSDECQIAAQGERVRHTDTDRQTDKRSFWINWESLMSSFAAF